MKIAFLVGGFEPEVDGVGDYTRLLAQTICAASPEHECCIVALNDLNLSELELQPASPDNGGISQLRLPSTMAWGQRTQHAQRFLDEFSPDWVSLQFVCYAFNPKGIVYGLGAKLRPLMRGRQLHVMCHETWIGEDKNAPLKERLVGALQRYYVISLLKSLKPAVVHTSNVDYQMRLERYAIATQILPVFGSVPISEETADQWLFPLLQQHNIPLVPTNRHDFWLCGFFGSIPAIWPPEPLFSTLHAAAKAQQKQVVILSVGRTDNAVWEKITASSTPMFAFIKLGERPAEAVSQYLNSLDMGIAGAPLSLVGKSSSVATMLDHGLPVIVNRVDLSPAEALKHGEAEALLYPLVDALPADLQRGLQRRQPCQRLSSVAQEFLQSLGAPNPA